MQIFTFGPKYSNCYKIAEKFFPKAIKHPSENLKEISHELQKDKSSFAILPIHNPKNGINHKNIKFLIENRFHIWDTLNLSPKLTLAASSRNISTICSTQENFDICEDFLKEKFPKLKQFITPDLKTAIEHSLYNQEVCCIIPEDLLKILDLQKISETLNDPTNNQITYGLINIQPHTKIKNKSYIGIQIEESKSTNQLLNILHPFKEHQVEIFKIHSLSPSPEYSQQLFCFEIEGDSRQARFRQIQVFLERDLKICKIYELGGLSNSILVQNH